MIKIYTGHNITDCRRAAGTSKVFEDMFPESMASEYPDMWKFVPDETPIVCKTMDAIRCAPEDSLVVRVGRSVKSDNFGELLEQEESLSTFVYVEDIGLVNSHMSQRAP